MLDLSRKHDESLVFAGQIKVMDFHRIRRQVGDGQAVKS